MEEQARSLRVEAVEAAVRLAVVGGADGGAVAAELRNAVTPLSMALQEQDDEVQALIDAARLALQRVLAAADALASQVTVKDFLMSADERAKRRGEWVENVALNVDAFVSIGYWGMGIRAERAPGAWLVFEHEGPHDFGSRSEIWDHANAVAAAFDRGEPLPAGWYLLDHAAAERAYALAERKWGEKWEDGPHGDALGYDVVLQAALLGEVRYG